MSDIDSIVSLVPKKKKSINQPSSQFSKQENNSNNHIHQSKSTPKPYKSNNFNQSLNQNNENIITKYSEKVLETKKISDEDIFFSKKSKSKIISEKDLLQEEEDYTIPLTNLEKKGKPNYLIKSDYIKNKSLTPKENIFQHNLNPIYDFYKMDQDFNTITDINTDKTKKNKDERKNTNFTQYYNNFIKLNSKDNLENEPMNTINEISNEIITPKNDEENNMEYNKNFFEKQNIGDNTPAQASLGDNFSPMNDFFDENIFNNENNNNFNKSPLNYKQMNVNININNNQQNNNIYYHFPYIVNNVNSGNANNNYYFNNNYDGLNNNNNNNGQNEFNENECLYEGNNNNIQMNEDMNLNELNKNFRNKNNHINSRQNYYDKNNIIYEQMNNNNNNFQINFDYNNINEEGYNKNNINFNKVRNNNINLNNMNLNSDINSIKLNEILKYKNLENYLNNYSAMNNNNNNINNGNINYNIQLNNISNNNKNYSQNIYNNRNINNNLNNNLNYLQMLSNYNNNNIYNNQFQNINQDILYFNNNKNNISYQNPNQNQQIYNNYNPYPNNLINNFGINNYNNNIYNNNYNQDNNIYEQNNLNLEQILLDMSPYELIDKCYIFAKFQSGCRFLQDYLTENSNNNGLIKSFFEKVLEHIRELSKGQFSHYFVKKLLLFINEFQIMKLIKILSPMIEDISTNQYGTKVIQDIIDLIKTDKTYNLMLSIITPYIKQLIIDLNGTQIIFKLIVKSKDTKIIDDCICKNIKEIACSKKGSNFLIKYFEFAEEEDILNIKKNVLLNLKDIITDQFGNYVIQNILLKTNTEILQNFVDEIKNNIIFYSNNKFASNAVEKCFQNDRIKNEVLKLFMSKDIFNKIILDKFGNYVAQKAIAAADDQDRKILIDLLKLTIPELKNKYFGEKLISKIQFLYPNFF